jgi:hypothetical protein
MLIRFVDASQTFLPKPNKRVGRKITPNSHHRLSPPTGRGVAVPRLRYSRAPAHSLSSSSRSSSTPLPPNPRSLPAPSPELRIPSAAAGARPRASPWASCSRGSSRRSSATARHASSSSASTMPARPPYSVSLSPPVSSPFPPRISAGPPRICGEGSPILIPLVCFGSSSQIGCRWGRSSPLSQVSSGF